MKDFEARKSFWQLPKRLRRRIRETASHIPTKHEIEEQIKKADKETRYLLKKQKKHQK